jgi:anti-anti-sigma factor
MALVGSSWFTVSDRLTLSREGREAGPIVIWLWGEHDLSTDEALCATLARAIAVDSPGLVLDLSEVDFIAVSTLRVIVRARDFLQQRLRSLTVRWPSRSVRRVIDVCGLTDLLAPRSGRFGDEPEKALGTWVAVHAAPWCDPWTGESPGVPEYVPVEVGRTIDLRARTVSDEEPAEHG